MSIKAVFVDFDYTIYSHKKQQIPPSTIKALNLLHENGIKVVLATGRNLLEMSIFPEYEDIKFDGFLLLNGQLCLDNSKKTIYENPLKGKTLETLIDIFNAKQMPLVFVEKDDVFINYQTDSVKEACGELKILEHKVKPYSGKPLFLAVAYNIKPEDESNVAKMIPDISFQRWSPSGVDIVSKGADKFNGIKVFMEHFGIDQSQCMAIGDSFNDIKMIEYAGIGVAMGNAIDSAKQKADFVTRDIDSDGIEFALKYFNLI